jgi:hypothetical protein
MFFVTYIYFNRSLRFCVFILGNVTVQGLAFFLPTIVHTMYPKIRSIRSASRGASIYRWVVLYPLGQLSQLENCSLQSLLDN